MRTFTAGIFASLTIASGIQAAAKPAPTPRGGVKTPGIQIPWAGVTADATVPVTDKSGWVFFLADSPGGGGGGRGAAGGGRGGGRGGRGAGPAAAAAPAAGFVLIPAEDKLLKIDMKTNKPVDPIAGLKKPCGGAVSAFGSLWVSTCGDGALQRIDPRTSKITATVASGASGIRGSIAASTDSIWLLSDKHETLSRIDPDQNAVVGEVRLPAGCESLAFGETSLWLACPEQNKVLRINPATNVVDKRIEVSGKPIAIALGENSVWVLCAKDGKVDRIDPKTDKVTKTIDLMAPGVDGGIAFGDGYVWVTMTGFPVTRIDVTSEAVAQQFWGEGGGGLTAVSGALWLSNVTAGTVTRIDPKLLLATLAE